MGLLAEQQAQLSGAQQQRGGLGAVPNAPNAGVASRASRCFEGWAETIELNTPHCRAVDRNSANSYDQGQGMIVLLELQLPTLGEQPLPLPVPIPKH